MFTAEDIVMQQLYQLGGSQKHVMLLKVTSHLLVTTDTEHLIRKQEFVRRMEHGVGQIQHVF